MLIALLFWGAVLPGVLWRLIRRAITGQEVES